MQTGEQALLDQIDAYNREDCIATLLLRDWLLERRAEALAQFGPFPLPGAEGAEADAGGEGRARGAARAAARRGRGARRPAPRLPRPRAQAGLVGVLRPDRDDADGARRGLRVDRPARARQRARAGEEVAGVRAQLPRAGAQARAGAGRGRPGDARGRGGDPRARPRGAAARRSSAGRSSRTCRCPRRSSRGAPYWTKDQEDALVRLGRSLLAGDTALPGARVRAPARAVRPADPDHGPRRDEGARALARRPPPRHPGAARLGQDVDVRAADRAPARERQDGRRRLDEPQGDPQPARRGRRGGGRARDRLRRAQEGERRQPGVVLPAGADRGRRARRRDRSAPTSRPARRGSSPARTSRSTTCSSTRRARCRSQTRSRWGRRRGTSCSSATRSSSTR